MFADIWIQLCGGGNYGVQASNSYIQIDVRRGNYFIYHQRSKAQPFKRAIVVLKNYGSTMTLATTRRMRLVSDVLSFNQLRLTLCNVCINLLCVQSGVFTSCEIRTLVEDGESSEFKALTAAFKNSSEVSDGFVLNHSSAAETARYLFFVRVHVERDVQWLCGQQLSCCIKSTHRHRTCHTGLACYVEERSTERSISRDH
jgi:hypothetical protein